MVMGTPSFMAPIGPGSRPWSIRGPTFLLWARLVFSSSLERPTMGRRPASAFSAQHDPRAPERVRQAFRLFSRDRHARHRPRPRDRYPSIEALRSDLQLFVQDRTDFPVVEYRAGRSSRAGPNRYGLRHRVGTLRSPSDRRRRSKVRMMGPGGVWGDSVWTGPSAARRWWRSGVCRPLHFTPEDQAELDGMRLDAAFMRTLAGRLRSLIVCRQLSLRHRPRARRREAL